MKNNSESKIVITFMNIDQADRFYNAIIDSDEFLGIGGDSFLNSHFIGHDVNVKNVEHILTGEPNITLLSIK